MSSRAKFTAGPYCSQNWDARISGIRARVSLAIAAVRSLARNRAVAGTFFCFVLGALLVLAGCKGSGAVTVGSISISPSSASVTPGSQADFRATVNLNNSSSSTAASTSTAVTWEVNGVVGGNSTIGTIVSSSTDVQVGVYTAPAVVPSTNNGQVNITAVADQTGATVVTTANTANQITSNTAVVTVGVVLGFSIGPTISTIAAGSTTPFVATLNGITDVHATWSVVSAGGGSAGSIGATTGTYVAPLLPPAGNSITITGQDGTNTASETFTISYSDHSLNGPYAFSYSGDNSLGFYAVAGSFEADGNGNIESGVEDIDSFQNGVSTIPINGNYVVNGDGRGTITLNNGSTLRFVIASNQHAFILRADAQNIGSGTIDQQSINDLTGATNLISGPYVFNGSGASTNFAPLGMAGEFFADGLGNIAATPNSILDVNAGGTVTQADRSLSGSYVFDNANYPGSGRGTLTLTSATTAQRVYAFYLTDNAHFHFVEIDHNAFLAGDAASAPSGNAFTAASLANGNFVFTSGGNSSAGAYASGGVFTSNGTGSMSGGAFDSNNAGTVQTNVTLSSCAYSVDATTGRVDLKLCGAGTTEFALYQTAQNSALLLQLDATAVATGVAYQQQAASTGPSGNFGFRLAGRGIFHNAPGSYQQDVEGQFTSSGSSFTAGNIDLNTFNEPFLNDPINIGTTTTNGTSSTASSIKAAGSNGRGTAVVAGTNPNVTYNLVYYLINSSTALLFDQDKGFILTGILASQY